MAATLSHRGPDASGVFVDPDAGLGFGHTRLSIVDLSPAGAQPMISASGRYVITYNGEIYNAAELRPELEALGHRFRGHSDTEVIVEAVAEWGVPATVKRLIGMFAFAIWDRKDRRLTLGARPARHQAALSRAAEWAHRVRLGAEGVRGAARLEGRAQRGRARVLSQARLMCPRRIRSIAASTSSRRVTSPPSMKRARSRRAPIGGLPMSRARDMHLLSTLAMREATDMLEALLGDAVKRRLVADVPLGAFLSGGIDSSTVAAMMRANSTAPVRTYSIGFGEAGYDEAPHARAVARHLGTEHTELYVSPARGGGGHPAAPLDLRRAVRRFIASSDLSSLQAHAPARDGGALGRRRRRIVRGLYAAPLRPRARGSACERRQRACLRARQSRDRRFGTACSASFRRGGVRRLPATRC